MLKTAELRITAVTPSDIPRSVSDSFCDNSASLTMDGGITLDQFDHLIRIDGMDATSYLGEHEKLYATGDTERVAYIVDMTEDGVQTIGRGELRYNDSSNASYYKDKPFVGFTKTYSESPEANFARRGYGMRRLHALNLAAHTLYSLPLHSDTVRKPEATRLWERLVMDDLAEKYAEGRHDRYKFVR